jgi:hypothetical protein
MRSSDQRIAAYNARMQSSQIDPVLTAVEDLAKANYASYIGVFYPYQVSLRDWMNDEDIHGSTAFAYEAFNGEVYSAWRRFAGGTLDAMVTALVDKYEALGLTRARLIAAALTVWGITVT